MFEGEGGSLIWFHICTYIALVHMWNHKFSISVYHHVSTCSLPIRVKKKGGGDSILFFIWLEITKWILTAIHVVCINGHVFQESKVWHLILLLLNQLYPYVRTCNFATHHLFCYVFWPRLDFFFIVLTWNNRYFTFVCIFTLLWNSLVALHVNICETFVLFAVKTCTRK